MRAFIRYFSIQNRLKTSPIVENLAAREFQIKINDDSAVVNFNKINESTYDLVHTTIPDTYKGQGLGSIIAERIFDHLVQNNKKIKVSCEFLQKYLDRNIDKYKRHVWDG